MNKALLDTDIFSEVSKAVDPNVVRNAAAYYQLHGRLTISVITVMEVIKGLHKAQRPQKIQTLLGQLAQEEVLSFDQADAELAGRIQADLERAGQPIGIADTMIAAVALHHGWELVTGNTTHFQHIQQVGYPLIVLNWRV